MEVLTAEELRVLGALIEKEATTPDQYPLTMNGLLSATNQTSNRNPVVTYGAATVAGVITHLRELGLARVVHSPSNRAEKYRHVVHEAWALSADELAVLAVLVLRGPQTATELRSRTERYGDLEDMGGVEGVLHRLKNRYDEPYVVRLERQPAHRDERWAHLLAGEILDVPAVAPTPRSAGNAERVAALEAQVAQLTDELTTVRTDLDRLLALLD
ncbi:MAG: YceH family protein [Actinomycetota bacterium]|nr:YceH family protein [Actinomycetota bacterium]